MKLRALRKKVLYLTFLTGASALVYEVTWHQYLTNLLGSQAKASALILAVFLGGIGVGYAVFGKLSRRYDSSRLISLCGIVEIGIGVWACAFLGFYYLIWSVAGVLPEGGGAALFVDTCVVLLLIALPTVLMGGTLPLLTQGLVRKGDDYSRLHAIVYAVNTAGAFVGCLCAGFFLIPFLGLRVTLLATALVNVIAGYSIFKLGKASAHLKEFEAQEVLKVPRSAVTSGEITGGTESALSVQRACLVAAIAGFYALTLQTVFTRLIGLSAGSSEYAFSMVVSAFILLIALGAWIIAGRGQRAISLWKNQVLLVGSILALYFTIPFWPYAFHVIRSIVPTTAAHFYTYHLAAFCFIILFLALPVITLGSTMPLLFNAVRAPFKELGDSVGTLYGFNMAGSVAGAFIGGHLLLYRLNIDDIYVMCLCLAALNLVVLFPWNVISLRSVKAQGVAVLAVCGFISLGLPSWDSARMGIGVFHIKRATAHTFSGPTAFYGDLHDGVNVIAYEDGPNTSVTVAEYRSPEGSEASSFSRSLMINGKSDGNTAGDKVMTRLLAHLPALLTPADTGKAAVVGFGTGMTVGALTLYPGIETIDCVEISPEVRDVASYFDFANNGAGTHSKVNWHISDAYRFFRSSDSQYDIVVSQPSNPWLSGTGRLFSEEMYELVKERLTERGVFVQWISTRGLSVDTVRLVMNTFVSVFPSVRVFQQGDGVIILGGKKPIGAEALAVLTERFSEPSVNEDLKSIGIHSPEVLLALEVWLPPRVFRGIYKNTVHSPRLSYWAGKDFFMDRSSVIEDIVADPSEWRWALNYSRKSLLGHWVNLYGEVENLRRVAETGCGSLKVKLVEPNWRYSRTVCRDALLALMVRGDAESPTHLKDEMKWIGEFQDDSFHFVRTPRQKNAEHALKEIDLFAQFHSIFLPLSPKKLLWRVSHCYAEHSPENLDCRSQLINTLAYAGFTDIAMQELKRLKRDAGTRIKEEKLVRLDLYVRESALVAEAYG